MTSCPPAPSRTTLTEPGDGHTTPEQAGTVSSLPLLCLWLSLPPGAKNNNVHLLQKLKWCESACTNSLSSGVLSKQGKDPPRVRVLWEVSAFFFTSTHPVFLSFLAFIFPQNNLWLIPEDKRPEQNLHCCGLCENVELTSTVRQLRSTWRRAAQLSLDVFVCWIDTINKGPFPFFSRRLYCLIENILNFGPDLFFFSGHGLLTTVFWGISSLSHKDSFLT